MSSSSPTAADSSSQSGDAEKAPRVAVGQMTATGDVEANFQTCRRLVMEAKEAGVALLSLPECFSFIGARDGESQAIAETLDGPIMQRYRELAREAGLWLSLGGFQEVSEKPADGAPEGRKKIYNTHVLLDEQGGLRATYRKIHLFDVDVPGGPQLQESRSTAAGEQLVTVDSPVGRLGLTICYDLRFPELYQRLRFDQGAEILLVPSAFTRTTGEAHWEVLLRARAIECQCFVMAAAQGGRHNDRRDSYGDALIVDPWGTVIARCPERGSMGIAAATLDRTLLASVRTRMPVAYHRRYDVYGNSSAAAAAAKSAL